MLARQGYWAPSGKQIEAAILAANKPQVPGVAKAMRTMARLEPRGGVQAWVGLSRNVQGKTQATVTWEMAPGADAPKADRLELEVVAAGARTASGPPFVVPAAPARQDGRVDEPLVLPPGDVLLRFTARSADGESVDRWEEPLSVPDLRCPSSRSPRRSSTWPRRCRSCANCRRPPTRPRVRRACSVRPTAYSSTWSAIQLPAPDRRRGRAAVERDGKDLLSLPVPELTAGKCRFELPIRGLGKGTYMLRVRAQLGDQQSEHVTAFRVIP